MELKVAVAEYLGNLESVGRRSHNTFVAYRCDIGKFVRFADENHVFELEAVTPMLAERWTASMRDLADATVTRAQNALSSMFKWAIRFGYVTANPMDRVERPRKRRRVMPCPSLADVKGLLSGTEGLVQRAALLSMAMGGLRKSELLALTWERVDFPSRRMKVRGKGDKDREVTIFPELLAAFAALHEEQGHPESGPVVRGKHGGPVCSTQLQRWFDRWGAHAGMRQVDEAGRRNEFTLHSLRRFAAKTWLESGLNIRKVQTLLGHEDIQTTILYLSYDMDEIQRSAEGITFGLLEDLDFKEFLPPPVENGIAASSPLLA